MIFSTKMYFTEDPVVALEISFGVKTTDELAVLIPVLLELGRREPIVLKSYRHFKAVLVLGNSLN